ncbi:hypothetical protein H5410_033906 [Solanum commersonii]|uniref:Agenet domain-containing protein n=1 Tax=Solanum commersonii TaxID=4109 RepID=A0A9J5YS46_SOLCO|nr:hypothetical protein H5410_033906 [Solanum commersonii]
MARINVTEMNSEQLHQSRMAMLSESIKSIAFKKQQITKEFEKGDEVEVASQELGFIGSYYAATIICSTGDDYYRIKYKTLLTDDESVPLEDVFFAAEIRQKMDSVYTIWLMYLPTMDGGSDLSVRKLEMSIMSTSLQLEITLHILLMC